MKNVATIIANPEQFNLNETEVNAIIDALQDNGAIIENVEVLSEAQAVDIYFAVLGQEEADELLLAYLANVPVDHVVQGEYGRKKKLLICDMDSTIIQQECIDELAAFAGIKDKIAAITERAMNGELDFKDALRERVKMLEGLSENVLQEAFDKHITLMPGAKELVATMKVNGAKAVLVSGGFTFFTSRIQEIVGFDAQEANILEIEGGKLTGKVREPILDSQAKFNALHFYADEMGVSVKEALAVGDGANDLPMIKEAGVGVAIHAKPNVRAQAKVQVNNSDLLALLFLQGYKKEEFVDNA